MENIQNERIESESVLELEFVKPKFNKGEYASEILKAMLTRNVNTRYGISNRITIEQGVTVIEHDGKTAQEILLQTFYVRTARESKFSEFYESVMEQKLPMRFDLNDLIGKKLWIKIEHNHMEDGNVYDNVTSVTLFKNKLDKEQGTI